MEDSQHATLNDQRSNTDAQKKNATASGHLHEAGSSSVYHAQTVDQDAVLTETGVAMEAGPTAIRRKRKPGPGTDCKTPDPVAAAERHAFMAPYLVMRTLSEIAGDANITHSSLHRWYRGKSHLSVKNRVKLATALGVEVAKVPN
jgi:hypothetical protein